jgi:hypothetical protein
MSVDHLTMPESKERPQNISNSNDEVEQRSIEANGKFPMTKSGKFEQQKKMQDFDYNPHYKISIRVHADINK